MRRRVFLIVVLLILGAIVNVAVAWGLVVSQSNIQSTVLYSSPEPLGFPLTLFSYGVGRLELHCDSPLGRWKMGAVTLGEYDELLHRLPVERRNGYAAIWSRAMNQLPPTAALDVVKEHFCGYPYISLFGVEYSSTRRQIGDWIPESTQSGLIACRIRAGTEELLPFIPLPTGFAINTIFYAALLWAVFFVPGMARRTIRRKRGLCPACAYPIGSSPVCTECGAAISST